MAMKDYLLIHLDSMSKAYKCFHGVDLILPKVVEKHNFSFNLANNEGSKMGELAEKIYYDSKAKWATVPFCHTIEARAFGSKVELDYKNGNRIIGFPIERLKNIDMLKIPSSKDKKIQMVLDAIKYLKDRDVPIIVNVIGPVTLATSILPTEEVYRGMAKNIPEIKKLFSTIEEFLAEYISAIIDLDVDILSYADPSGTMDIIGKRLYKKYAGLSFLNVLKKVKLSQKPLIYICPRSTRSLLDSDLIEEGEEGIIASGGCISKGISGSKKYRVK